MMLLAVYLLSAVALAIGAGIVAIATRRYAPALAILIAAFALFGLIVTGTATGMYFNFDGFFGDLWTATETINKTRDGLLSSVDYFNPVGPVYSYVYALVSFVQPEPTAATIVHAGAVAGLVAALFSIAMLWRHMSLLGLSIVVLSVVGVAVSGRAAGELLYTMSMHYGAPYNRWGWALFIPVAVRLALPHGRDRAGDLALGIAVALLLMLKVTYGAAALGLLVARLVLLPGTFRELPGLAAGLIAVLGTIELATGQVSAHLRDLAATAALPESGLRIHKLFTQLGEAAIYTVAALVAYLATVQQSTFWADLRPVLLIVLVAGAGCAVLMQNHYAVEAAVYPLLTLIALEWTGVLRDRRVLVDLRERVLIAGAVVTVVFYPFVNVGMQVGQNLQYAMNGPDPAFARTPYANLRFEPFLMSQQDSLLNTVNDGRAGILEGLLLLRAAGAEAEDAGAVAALSFSNPFPMMLNRPSPAGTPIWLHEGRSYSRSVFMPPETFFDGVDFVMAGPSPGPLDEIYADTLAAGFEIAAKGGFWTLWTRRGKTPQNDLLERGPSGSTETEESGFMIPMLRRACESGACAQESPSP